MSSAYVERPMSADPSAPKVGHTVRTRAARTVRDRPSSPGTRPHKQRLPSDRQRTAVKGHPRGVAKDGPPLTVRHSQHKVRKPKAAQTSRPANSSKQIMANGYQDAIVIEGEGLYIGNYDKRDGTRQGPGMLMYTSGDVYTGEWDDNQRHGQGKIVYKNKAVYEGSWVHDVRQGFGVLIYANGDRYSGAWVDDMKQGVGQFSWEVQRGVYEGQFHDGSLHGQGIYMFADGGMYKGGYEHGERCGYGALMMPDGRRQEGEWRGNQCDSQPSDMQQLPPASSVEGPGAEGPGAEGPGAEGPGAVIRQPPRKENTPSRKEKITSRQEDTISSEELLPKKEVEAPQYHPRRAAATARSASSGSLRSFRTSTPPVSFRPDLAIKRDPTKAIVEKMLHIEQRIEELKLEAKMEAESGVTPTGEDDWDPVG